MDKNKRDYKARLVIYGLGKETKSKDVIKWLELEIKSLKDNNCDYSEIMVTLKLMK